ncbi:MAG: hypothetical protein KF864_06575 [Phycisphaeraceae bacterium]|nr:hypothetical protein [Phycisphaeraceae bacterium]
MMLARDIPKPEANGVPTVYAAGDVNRDGVCDGFDPQDWDDYNDYGVGALAVDLDVNRDGVVDSADRALVQGHADWLLWTNHGRGSVSRMQNRRGYAGYEYDPATSQWHVRNRVLVSEMGRWNRREPLGYIDGPSLYSYVKSTPLFYVDPSGLQGEPVYRKAGTTARDWDRLTAPSPVGTARIVGRAIKLENPFWSPLMATYVTPESTPLVHVGIRLANGDIWSFGPGDPIMIEDSFANSRVVKRGYEDNWLELDMYDHPWALHEKGIEAVFRFNGFDDHTMRKAIERSIVSGKYLGNNYHQTHRNCQHWMWDVIRTYDSISKNALPQDPYNPHIVLMSMVWSWLHFGGDCACYGTGNQCADGFGRPCVI